MRDAWTRIEELLSRVPADSLHGRRVKDELVDHFDTSIEPSPELQEALERFGGGDELEGDFYRDYLRSRYAFGVLDREWLPRIERTLLGVGWWLMVVGLLLHVVVPAVALYAAGMGLMAVDINVRVDGLQQSLGEAFDAAMAFAIPPELLVVPWGLVAAAGVVLGALGGVLVMRRSRWLDLSGVGVLAVFAGVPICAVIFLLSFDAATIESMLRAAMIVSADGTEVASAMVTSNRWGYGVGLAMLLLFVGLGLFARRTGRADSVHLPMAAIAGGVLALGVLGLGHPILLGIVRDFANGVDVAPAQIAGGLRSDVLMVIAGAVATMWGSRRIVQLLLEIESMTVAQRR